MALNMNLVKDRLKKAKSGGSNFERVDYDKLYFKPKADTTYSVRIVPNKLDKEFPFTEVEVHNYNAFKKTIPTLRNWNEADPIIEFRQGLYDEIRTLEKDKKQDPQEVAKIKAENEAIAKNIGPRKKYALPVIVRGQEADGVKIWEVNITNYETILGILADEDNGDVTDVVEGTDLKVVGYTAIMKATGRAYTEVTITVKKKSTPLSDDETLVEKWLEEQKDPREVFKKYTAEELKGILRAYLFPEEAEEDAEEEATTPSPATKTTFKKTAPAAPAKPAAEDDDEEDEQPAAPATKTASKGDLPWEAEDEEEKPVAKASASKAIKAKQALAAVNEDDEDELSEAIPKVSPKAKVAAKKPQASRFAAIMDDDEE